MERALDWRAFVNRLVFCFGCGRFGLPAKGATLPRDWSMLYQPHGDGPAGLHVCSERCKDDVRVAMRAAPVTEPLSMATNITMSSEMREQMMADALRFAMSEGGMIDAEFMAVLEAIGGKEEDGES